jgi:hypothetical protein
MNLFFVQYRGQSESAASKAKELQKLNEILEEKAAQSNGDISLILLLSMLARERAKKS